MPARIVRIAAVLALGAALSGCGGDGGAEEALPPVERAPTGFSAEEQAVAEGAARAFAEDVRAGRADSVAERLGAGAFVRGVCRGTGASAEIRGEFEASFRIGMSRRPGGLLSEHLGRDFHFLRLLEVEGSTQMLFRAWDEEAGIDYLRCAFDKADADGWRIVDIYSYTSGEAFTDSVRRTFLPVLAGGGEGSELRAQFEPLAAVVEHLEAGDHRSARRALLVLPEGVREGRYARTLELQALAALDDAADDYAAAVDRFEQDYPGDPSLPLRMLEAHSIRGEHEAALRRIDQLEEMLGGDAFSGFLRAGALRGLGRGGEAIAGLEKAVAAGPEIESLRWALVDAALAEEEFTKVATTLRALRSEFDYQLGVVDLEGAEEYRGFVASKPGIALLAEMRAGGSSGEGD